MPTTAFQKDRDAISIDGDYQHKAVTQGFVVQRFWHHAKVLAIQKYLPPRPDDAVMDVGCGSGVIASFLGKSGAKVVGVDSNPEAVAFAARRYAGPNVSFILGMADAPAAGKSGAVDKIYCLELIEHIYEPQGRRMLQRFHELLKPGGRVFLTTPNYRSYWPALEWALDHSGLVPEMEGSQHVARYHPRRLARLCQESGFEASRIESMCLLSPWAALLNWRLAETVFQYETGVPFRLGPILIAVLTKA